MPQNVLRNWPQELHILPILRGDFVIYCSAMGYVAASVDPLNRYVLRKPGLGLFCSIRCPGKVILAVYDLARALRDAGIPVIGGFHTPMEKECLDLLLRGVQPIVVCPARGLDGMRLPAALRNGVESGRVTLLSPFGARQHRAKADLAEERNRFVAAVATEVFVAYAAPEGKTECLCRSLTDGGKSLLTLDLPENARLLDLGAKPVVVEDLARRWAVELG